VILDIPGTPAPIWLHREYPRVDIVAENGARLPPAKRRVRELLQQFLAKLDDLGRVSRVESLTCLVVKSLWRRLLADNLQRADERNRKRQHHPRSVTNLIASLLAAVRWRSPILVSPRRLRV
jgi:hypothetical protein